MTIDIVSDLHVSHYPTYRDVVEDIFKDVGYPSDVLVIAGDIDSRILLVKKTLSYIESLGVAKHILYVPGNNEMYLSEEDLCSYKKYEDVIENVNSLSDRITALDGTTIEIGGLVFGGATMWYDGSYLRGHGHSLFELGYGDKILHKMNKSQDKYRKLSDRIENIFLWQKERLDKIKSDVDVMISHICPVPKDRYMSYTFQGAPSNAFFAFDGRAVLKEEDIKLWIFGHSHDPLDDVYENTRLICNPYGYPEESKNFCGLKRIVV